MTLLRHSYSYYLRIYFFPFFFRLLFRVRKPRRAVAPFKSVLFLRPGKLGDITVATPIFALIKKYLPTVHIAVACAESNNVMVQHHPHIDEMINLNFHRIPSLLKLIRLMRKRAYDMVVDLSPGMSSTNFFVLQLGGRRSILVGCDKELQEPFYDMPLRMGRIHIIDQNIAIAEALLGQRVDRPVRPFIATAPEHKIQAQALWQAHFKPHDFVIGVNCSAGSDNRQLSREQYGSILRGIRQVPHLAHCPILLFAVQQQRLWAQQYAQELRQTVLIPECSVLTVYELISKLGLLVSPDTSLIHFASAHGVPVVGMFSTHWQNAVRWAPYYVPHKIVLSPDEWGITRVDCAAVVRAVAELATELM